MTYDNIELKYILASIKLGIQYFPMRNIIPRSVEEDLKQCLHHPVGKKEKNKQTETLFKSLLFGQVCVCVCVCVCLGRPYLQMWALCNLSIQ